MKIKTILTIIYTIVFSLVSRAQVDSFGDIVMAVSAPEMPKGAIRVQQDKIKNKIIRSINKNSVSAVNTNSGFTVHSSFQLLDESTVGGVRTRVTISSEIYLRIEQKGSKNIFSTYSKKINGIGGNREQAINNAIKNIVFDESGFKAFIEKGKQEIISYYTNNCDRLIRSVQTAYDNGNFKKAIILSASIPSEAESCFSKAKEITSKSYLAYRNTFCKKLLLAARSALAQNNFKLAGKHLSYVDPQSECYNEAETLLKEINKQFNEHQQLQQQYDLEVLQLYAITQILTEYYGNANPGNGNNANNGQQFNNISNTGPNVFLIAVADTQDEKIGKSTEKDLISVTNLFRKAAKELGIGYGEKKLYANTFDKKNIYEAVNSFPVKNDDIFIFYYSGHGINDTQSGSLFPKMSLDGDDLLLEKLHQMTKSKKARLTITIGDLCNSLPRSKVKIETKKEAAHKSSYLFDKEKLKKLLLQSSGDAISTSSRKGQWSFCGKDEDGSMGNGQFTNAFLNKFSDATTKNSEKSSPSNWNIIFKSAYQQALNETKKIKNQDGAYGQFGFNIININ